MTTNLKSNTINTNTLEPNAVATLVNAYTTQTGKMQIGSSSNTGVATNVGICVAPITTGTIRTISIGKTTVDSVHVANVEHIGPAIGNATAPLAGDFDICSTQTTGILNIGTGVRTTTGDINIGTGSTTSAINIGNKTTTGNTVVINSGSGGIVLASNNATVGQGINIKNNTVDVNKLADVLSVGTTNATGGITIGNSTQSNITVGAITIGNGTIQRGGVGDSLTIAPNTTIGNLSFGIAQTSGTLDIGTGARTSGNINIGTGSTQNTITIGNKTNTTNGVTISAGTPGITLSSGTGANLSGIKVTGNTVDVVTATETLNIAPSQLTGILNIGVGARTGTGVINLGTGNQSSTINIGFNGLNAQNKVFINSGPSGTSFLSNAGSNGINIATTVVDTFTTGTLSLGTLSANNVSIGTSGTTTVNNALTATGLTTANGGLTMGGANNITLGTGATAPTAGTQLGGITAGTFTTPGSAFSVTKDVATLTVPQVGVYIFFFTMQTNYTVKPTSMSITLGGTALPLPTYSCGDSYATPTIGTMTSSFLARITTVGTVILTFNLTGTIDSLGVTSYSAVRIA
jgi:hypothetical protein